MHVHVHARAVVYLAQLLEKVAGPLIRGLYRRPHRSSFSRGLHFVRVQIMRQLLAKGADIDVKTQDGDTPLSLAISAGAVGSVGFLVKAGASLDLEDKVRVGGSQSRVVLCPLVLVD